MAKTKQIRKVSTEAEYDAANVTMLPDDFEQWPNGVRYVYLIVGVAGKRFRDRSLAFPHVDMPDWYGPAQDSDGRFSDPDEIEHTWPRWVRHALGLIEERARRRVYGEEHQPVRYRDIPEVGERDTWVFTEGNAKLYLAYWVREGITKASALTGLLAHNFGLTYGEAERHRKRLGFTPAYRGGPVVTPREVEEWAFPSQSKTAQTC